MNKYSTTIEVTLVAPFISQASGETKPGLDALMLRSTTGRCALPGTLIKGNFRHALATICRHKGNDSALQNQVDRWFGKSSDSVDDARNTPFRGTLQFEAYWEAQQSGQHKDNVQYRIRINDTGTVEKGHFQVIEQPFLPGTEVTFTGKVHFWAATKEKATEIQQWLQTATNLIDALGAFKGAGFGSVQCINVCPPQQVATNNVNVSFKNNSAVLMLQPESAFCFASHALGNNTPVNQIEADETSETSKGALQNRFDSLPYIPGAAIKGAIATQLYFFLDSNNIRSLKEDDIKHLTRLQNNLDTLVISHAQPSSTNNVLPIQHPPLSRIAINIGKKNIFDDVLCNINDHNQSGYYTTSSNEIIAPTFSTDWKPKAFIDYACVETKNSVLPDFIDKRVIEIHTAIDAETNAASEHQLFSYDCIPQENSRAWFTQIKLPDFAALGLSEEEQKETTASIEKALSLLLNSGLDHLGKTDVTAKVSVADKLLTETLKQATVHNSIVNTLFEAPQTTFAMVLNSDDATLLAAQQDSISDDKPLSQAALFDIYKSRIEILSDNLFTLKAFFAEQTLAGGSYIHERFWKERNAHYKPVLLTKAESVFLLTLNVDTTDEESIKDNVRQKLQQWADYGLGYHSEEMKNPKVWQDNPFISSLGFGHVYFYLPSKHAKQTVNGKATWHTLSA